MPIFKNIVAYRIGPHWVPPQLSELDTELSRLTFQPCGQTQEVSTGWITPRGPNFGAMVEPVAGQWILHHSIERKNLPGPVLKAEVAKRCEAIAQERGRPPGAMERKDIKSDVRLNLLPRAFARRSDHHVWIDPIARVLVIEASSMKAAEPVIEALVNVMAELRCPLVLTPLSTVLSPSAAMASWLVNDNPHRFTIDRDLQLQEPGEKSKIRYVNHSLDLDEIRDHVRGGKYPTQLALTWNSKVSFVLTDALTIRKIELLDVGDAPKDEDGFDADIAIATSELGAMIPDLLLALGGEMELRETEPA